MVQQSLIKGEHKEELIKVECKPAYVLETPNPQDNA
jgi:hypothetical protein